MLKKFLKLLFLSSIIWSITTQAYAAEAQKSNINFRNEEIGGDALLVINGRLSPYPPLIKDGTSFIPASAVTDTLGTSLEWKDEEGNPSTHLPARFVAEALDYDISFDRNVTAVPVISLEQKYNSPGLITADEAAALVKANVSTLFRLHYKNTKKSEDIDLFLNEISYKSTAPSMGRFYRTEIHFYDLWSKRFESQAYVDMYTKQVYIGDLKYGLTENILPYLIEKYENHLPIENNTTKIIPFSEINIRGEAPLVMVNFPEQIPPNGLLETYFNRVESISGSGRVFVSHKNTSNQTIDYIIRFKSEADEEGVLSLIWDKGIHTTEEYQDQAIREHLLRFYKQRLSNSAAEIILKPGEVYDAVITDIEKDQFFTGILDFTSQSPVSITVFAVADELRNDSYSFLATPSVAFDYGYVPVTYVPSPSALENEQNDPYYTTYSGLGAGYRIEATGIIRASEMLRPHATASGFNLAFETGGSVNNINHRNDLTEIIDIELLEPRGAGGEITKATWMGAIPADGDGENSDPNKARNYGNLGNWGVEYEIKVQLINDTDTDKVFRCELVPLHQTTWAFIVDGNASATNLNNKKYIDNFNRVLGMESDRIHIGSGIRSGNVGGVIVKAGETQEFSYTYVLGTECESTVFHVWTSTDKLP